MKNFVTLNQKWETDQYTPKAASTVFQNGGFITYDGLGGVIPSVAGAIICGLGQEDVLASDVDFLSTRSIAFQEVGPNVYFTIPVEAGTTLTYGTLVGTFVVGEVVTGGTSGATGVIVTDNGATIMVLAGITGTFAALETITGGTSGATAAIVSSVLIPGADATMVGSVFDLLTPEVLDVSGAGTQIEVTKFISANLVEGKVVLFA